MEKRKKKKKKGYSRDCGIEMGDCFGFCIPKM